jgi:hypothetical protein
MTEEREAERTMAVRMTPPRTDPELLKALAAAKEAWAKMTPDEQEAMLRKQRESWARQDMD